jgi:hypothetical protein
MKSLYLAAASIISLLVIGCSNDDSPTNQSQPQLLLSESFENSIDSRISFEKSGTFSTDPGINNISVFGSAKAFGFGRSNVAANAFWDYFSILRITFPSPTYVSTIRFKEIELYGNWGGQGEIRVNSIRVEPDTILSWGRSPQNDRIADTSFRIKSLVVDRTLQTIEIVSFDITNQSENVIDDLEVFGASK